jgi:hypothetical protein
VRASVVPAARGHLDVAAVTEGGRKGAWSRVLARPEAVEHHAVLMLDAHDAVEAVRTDEGWRFASDPTDIYGQDTPRQALRALVRAVQAERWDVLVRLAPRRYRMGLSQEDLARAWTEGDLSKALRKAHERLAANLAGSVVADDHEATLDLGDGHKARLEREGARWVVVDF